MSTDLDSRAVAAAAPRDWATNLSSVSADNLVRADANQAPIAANVVIAAVEDTPYIFSAANFHFSDADGDPLSAVKVMTLPTAGRLDLGNGSTWSPVTVGQVISRAAIDAGHLRFVPAADANGAGYSSFGFKVSDGDLLSVSTYTATVNVAAVRDDLTIPGTPSDDVLTGDTIDAGSYDHLSGYLGNDKLYGLGGNDFLEGHAGNDLLVGGLGADTMNGGTGNDTYFVDNLGDVVHEAHLPPAEGGYDLICHSLANYTLAPNVEYGRILSTGAANITGNSLNNVLFAAAGNNILNGGWGADTADYRFAAAGVTVNLALTTAQATGGSGFDTLSSIEHLTGSAFADRLIGNSAANLLNGLGGVDTLIGGDGSDVYYVDTAADVVIETNANRTTGGVDTVYSLAGSYTLGSNVENGRVLAASASNLIGNDLANTLFAGAGNNVLNGGFGADSVSYVYATKGVKVDLSVVTAQATLGSGSDTLVSVENLVGSTFADELSGNNLANVLGGGAGNDLLDGGLGNDILTGGLGQDVFRFDTVPSGVANRDQITDFQVVDDTIRLENAVFASLQYTGTLAAANFRASTAGTAADANDFILYDTDSGGLYYDADGSGAGAALQVAIVGVGLSLTAADFVVS